MKPLICVTASTLYCDGPERDFANCAYLRMIVDNGGIPLVVSSRILSEDGLSGTIDAVDGLLVAGGPDVDPHLYGEEPEKGIGSFDPQRDEAEVELVKLAVASGKPIFGICRGMQVINVAMGGSLYQDIGGDPDCFVSHYQSSPRWMVTHSVTFESGHISRLSETDTVRVNSFHHQAVKKVGDGLLVTGRSADGVPESLEHVDKCPPSELSPQNYVVAVQWHIEEIWRSNQMRPLIQEFMQVCVV